MKIRLLKSWRHYREGFILDPGAGVADILVNRRHLAEYVKDEVRAEMVPQNRKGKREQVAHV